MVGTTTIQAVAKSLTATVSPTVSTVNALTSYVFTVVLTDPLTSTGMIYIRFPSTITPTLTSACVTLSGTGVLTNPTCSYSSSTVQISGISSSATISAQTLTVTVLSVQNAASTSPSATFTIETYYRSTTTGIVATYSVPGVTATIGTTDISTVTVTPSSYTALATSVAYTLQFTNKYSIPQSGIIKISVPLDIVMDTASASSYCSVSLNSAAYATTICSATNNGSAYVVTFSSVAGSAIAAGSTIALKISQVFTNPTDTRVVSSFTIETFAVESSVNYAIEGLFSGISVQMTTPATMSSMGVTRSSSTNSATSVDYTIRLKQLTALIAGNILYVTFPTDITLSSSPTCASLSAVVLPCSLATSTQLKVTLAAAYSISSEFGVVVSGCTNPPSFAPLSSAFSFLTQSASGLVEYAQGSLTSSLVNNVASAFADITFSFSPKIYGEATSVDLEITPSTRIVPSYLIVTLPSSFSTTAGISCTSWDCTSIASLQLRANGATAAQMSITVTGFSAPISAPTQYTKITSYTAADYKIDESAATVIFAAACTLPCRTCTSTLTNCLSCYSAPAISTLNLLY